MAATKSNQSTLLITGGMLLAAALSLAGAIQYWSAESAYQRQSADQYRIADQAARLAGVRDAVPANAVLGYLTDRPADDTLATSMFFAAQYALAPRLLQKSQTQDLVLGNFTKPADFAAPGREHGLR